MMHFETTPLNSEHLEAVRDKLLSGVPLLGMGMRDGVEFLLTGIRIERGWRFIATLLRIAEDSKEQRLTDAALATAERWFEHYGDPPTGFLEAEMLRQREVLAA